MIFTTQGDSIPADSSSNGNKIFTVIETAEEAETGDKDGRKGRRVRYKERGSTAITGAEKELLEWAVNGFLPTGPTGLKPKSG